MPTGYTPQSSIDRRKTLMNQLRQTPMNDTGKKTDWGRGLAHMLRQYQAGSMGREQEAEISRNSELSTQDNALLAELIQDPKGNAAPDFSNMAITEGMDQGMVQGAQNNAVDLPSIDKAEFATPEGQKSRLALMLREKSNKDALELERQKNAMKPQKTSFETTTYTDSEGNERNQAINYNPYDQTATPVQVTGGYGGDAPQSGLSDAVRGSQSPTTQNPIVDTNSYSNPKLVADKLSTKNAKDDMSSILKGVATNFQELYQLSGAVSNEQDWLTNLKNGVLGNETVNQIQEGIGGSTVASGLRRSILQARPLLVGKIIQASDMSAKALDSNRELDFYLSALADPSLNIQSQMAALSKLNNLMGNGESLPWAESVADTTRQLEKQLEVEFEKQAVDIAFTAKKYNMTEEEVKRKLSEQLVTGWNNSMQEEY